MTTEYTAGMWIDTNVDNGSSNQFTELMCCEGTGTLGCFAKDASGKPVLLSCQHVLFPNDHAPPDAAVFQPRFSCCCSGDQIAKQVVDKTQLKDGIYSGGYSPAPAEATVRVKYHGTTVVWNSAMGFRPTVTDCGAALLAPGLKFRNVWKYTVGGVAKEIPLVGSYKETPASKFGVMKGPPFGTLPAPTDYVRVYSERLGRVVYGTILGLPGSPTEPPPVGDPQRLLYPDGVGDSSLMHPVCLQLMFLPRPDPDPANKKSLQELYADWSGRGPDHGDSGTLVINSDGLIIGMVANLLKPAEIFAGDALGALELADVSAISMVTPIADIEALLGVTIPDDPKGWSGPAPSEGARVFVPGRRDDDESARQRGLRRMREGLQKSRRGRLLLGKIAQHGRELRLMFQRVRALASGWQTLRGPSFLHHGVQSLQRAGHVVPTTIDGVSRRALVDAMLPIVEQHASPALRRDISRYRAWMEATLLDLSTVDDAIDAVALPWGRP